MRDRPNENATGCIVLVQGQGSAERVDHVEAEGDGGERVRISHDSALMGKIGIFGGLGLSGAHPPPTGGASG